MIEQGDVEVTYCPIKYMWSDVLTKPKHGKAFCEDRAVLINCMVDYEDIEDWEDIGMISGVSNPGCAPSSTTVNQRQAKTLRQKILFCDTSPTECVGG